MLVFRVLPHPQYTHVNFVQCIDKDAYNSNTTRLLYLFSSLFFMYLLPLLVIIFCYTGIVVSLARRSAPRRTDSGQLQGDADWGCARGNYFLRDKFKLCISGYKGHDVYNVP